LLIPRERIWEPGHYELCAEASGTSFLRRCGSRNALPQASSWTRCTTAESAATAGEGRLASLRRGGPAAGVERALDPGRGCPPVEDPGRRTTAPHHGAALGSTPSRGCSNAFCGRRVRSDGTFADGRHRRLCADWGTKARFADETWEEPLLAQMPAIRLDAATTAGRCGARLHGSTRNDRSGTDPTPTARTRRTGRRWVDRRRCLRHPPRRTTGAAGRPRSPVIDTDCRGSCGRVADRDRRDRRDPEHSGGEGGSRPCHLGARCRGPRPSCQRG
jgi:hypothetical protein